MTFILGFHHWRHCSHSLRYRAIGKLSKTPAGKQASRNTSATEDKTLYKVHLTDYELFCEDQKTLPPTFSSGLSVQPVLQPAPKDSSSVLYALYNHLCQDKTDTKTVHRIRTARLGSKLPQKLSIFRLAKTLGNVHLGLPSSRQKCELGDGTGVSNSQNFHTERQRRWVSLDNSWI